MPRPRVEAVRAALGQLLWPGTCCLCDGPLPDPLLHPACGTCRAALEEPGPPPCPRCGQFPRLGLAAGACESCPERAPRFRSAVAVGRHDGPLRRAVSELKYRRREPLARTLGGLLVRAYRERAVEGAPPAAVAPAPMSFWRRRRRGFNQAELLAAPVARSLGAPLLPRVLSRKSRPPQTDLSPAGRRRNLRGAFRAAPAADRAGLPILLVDDVFTTGSTVEAAIRALARAGWGPVDVVTVTRSRPESSD